VDASRGVDLAARGGAVKLLGPLMFQARDAPFDIGETARVVIPRERIVASSVRGIRLKPDTTYARYSSCRIAATNRSISSSVV